MLFFKSGQNWLKYNFLFLLSKSVIQSVGIDKKIIIMTGFMTLQLKTLLIFQNLTVPYRPSLVANLMSSQQVWVTWRMTSHLTVNHCPRVHSIRTASHFHRSDSPDPSSHFRILASHLPFRKELWIGATPKRYFLLWWLKAETDQDCLITRYNLNCERR